MAVNENIRISKVLKEFNIGMGTLMEFLQKKGITVDANRMPNSLRGIFAHRGRISQRADSQRGV